MKLIRPNMVEHRYYRDMEHFLANVIRVFNKRIEELGENPFDSKYSEYCRCNYINKVFKPKISNMFSEYGVKVTVYDSIDDRTALRKFIQYGCTDKPKKGRIDLNLIYNDDKFTEQVRKLIFAIKVSYKDGTILHMIQKDDYFGYYVNTKITPYKTYKNLDWYIYNNIHMQLHKSFIIGLSESDLDEYYEMIACPLHNLSKEEYVHLMVDNRYNTKATLKLMVSEYDNIKFHNMGRSCVKEILAGCGECVVFSLPIIRDDMVFPWLSSEYHSEYFGITKLPEYIPSLI